MSASGTYAGLGCSVSRDGTNVFSSICCTGLVSKCKKTTACVDLNTGCTLVNLEREKAYCGKLLQSMRFQELFLCSSL